ncbi:CCAAT-box DNA binding protein subunit B, partial [Plasmodium yoelii yoelii]
DDIHLYFPHDNNFDSQHLANLNNEENENYRNRNRNSNCINCSDIFTDVCEKNVTNNSENKLSNTNNCSSLLFLNTNKNVKKNSFKKIEKIEVPFSHLFNNTKSQACIKCHSKLDTNILRKKKKIIYNLFNLQNYYKKKKRKINYLAYDINILKEYLYIYLKKYFDDIIVLFEYFYFYFSNNTINVEYNDGNANKNSKDTNFFGKITNSKCDEKNRHDVRIYNEENIYNKKSIEKEINNQDNEQNEDLIYRYFFLCSYDNFSNGNDGLDNIIIKDKNKYSKYYINYILTKKLKLFIKNDLIQFINRNINLINNNIHLKIISVKRLFSKVLNNFKLSNSSNNLFIYQILYSMIIKYGKYNKNKIIKKNIMNKLSTWEWNQDVNCDIEKNISFLKKKKKYLQKFGLNLASLSNDVIMFLKYITTFDSPKSDYSNVDKNGEKNGEKKKGYVNCQIENTANSFYIDNDEELKKNNISNLSLNSIFYNLSSCRDMIYLKNVFHKMIKKKINNTITETPTESIAKWNKNKCKHVNKTKDDEEDFEQFSHIYEIIKQKSLKKYDNLKLFITIDKKKKTRKRKLDYDESLMASNFYNDNTNVMIKKIKKYIIRFIDDNKYVFPYIFNTFDNSTNYELNSYDIINLNNNFIFFHYINNTSKWSYKNSILNYIYGYPILNVYTKSEDVQNCYIKDISNNNNNIHFGQQKNGADKYEAYQECCNKKNGDDKYEAYQECCNKKNGADKYEAYQECCNKKNDDAHIERLQKIWKKNKRRKLINIFNNVKIFNKIPLKYIHLCVISDIFRYLNLHHIIQDIIKNLYIEKLKEIQEYFLFSKKNNNNLSNILVCFLFYFYSYLDVILGIRDGNFINLTNLNYFNIFNNFNDILLKKYSQKKDGNNVYVKEENRDKNKNKENYCEDSFNEDVKENYIYLNNELSHRNNYLWILKRKEKNVLSIPCVDAIYLKLRNCKK